MIAPVLALAMFLHTPLTPPEDLGPAQQLYKECQADIKRGERSTSERQMASSCTHYIEGFLSGIDFDKKTSVCFGHAPIDAMAHIFVEFMDKNPKLLYGDKATALYAALTDAYPCDAN